MTNSEWETHVQTLCGHTWDNDNGDMVVCELLRDHQFNHRGVVDGITYGVIISPAQHDLRANLCDSCNFREATVFVRFHDEPAPAFRVCEPCSREVEGLTATVLGVAQ